MDILKLIRKFERRERRRMEEQYEYYIGKQNILKKAAKAPGKPDNRLVTNYAKNIVNNTVGYYLGKPVVYDTDDAALMDQIDAVTKYNDDAFHNTQLGKDVSVFGRAAEILYLDSDDRIRYTKINPMNLCVGYSDDVEKRIEYAIRWYDVTDENDRETRHIEYYTEKDVSYYTYRGSLVFDRTEPHYWGDVPINVYENNEDCMGDYEDTIPLMDAYNVMQSESVNDFQKFADALLMVKNQVVTKETAEQLRDNNILELFDDGEASWLVKQVNDAYVENIKNRIEKDIYMSTNTVNMSDSEFANNASGVAISYKLICMENRVSCTERYFKKALQRRFELICNMLNLRGGNFDYTDIGITFSRNLPPNLQELATTIQQLSGIVSSRTLLAQLPFVESVEQELQNIAEETGGYADNFEGDVNDTGGILAETDRPAV